VAGQSGKELSVARAAVGSRPDVQWLIVPIEPELLKPVYNPTRWKKTPGTAVQMIADAWTKPPSVFEVSALFAHTWPTLHAARRDGRFLPALASRR
jgi:hypothetical protein